MARPNSNTHTMIGLLTVMTLGLLGWNIALQVQISRVPNFQNTTVGTFRELLFVPNDQTIGYNASNGIDASNFIGVVNVLISETASGKATGILEFFVAFSTTFVGDGTSNATLVLTMPSDRLHGLSFTQQGFPNPQLPVLFYGTNDGLMYPGGAFAFLLDAGTVAIVFIPPNAAPIQGYQMQYQSLGLGDYYPGTISGLPTLLSF